MVIGVLHHMSEIFGLCHTTCHRKWEAPTAQYGGAPTARNMKARGKREARRPWLSPSNKGPRPERPKYARSISPFQGWGLFLICYQGRRASRLPLAFILRAVGAVTVLRPTIHLARCAGRSVAIFDRAWADC